MWTRRTVFRGEAALDRGVCYNNLWLFKEIEMGSLNLKASEIFVVMIESKQIAKDYSMFSNQLL